METNNPVTPSDLDAEKQPGGVQPVRVRRFLTFFKNYMSLSTLVVAALPIPATMLKLIPTYAAHTKLLSVYTSLFCFLLVAFVFYSRHTLARWFFPAQTGHDKRTRSRAIAALPVALSFLCLAFLFGYQYTLQRSASELVSESIDSRVKAVSDEYDSLYSLAREQGELTPERMDEIYEKTYVKLWKELGLDQPYPALHETLKAIDIKNVRYNLMLIGLYLGFFLAAEAAFVLMALREYLQDLLGLSDLDLIYAREK